MWKCPKCQRSFKKINQSHYCGSKPKNIDEYIKNQDADKQDDLYLVYKTLQVALPKCSERISWSMPTFYKDGNIIHFACNKNHIGLYPGCQIVNEFKDQLKDYQIDKGTIHIPYGSIDTNLITNIAKSCLNNIYKN